ncbi:hypothetical protein SAMN04515668_4739 [Hymenobacter arizonensis]|uniref:Uncharacterized protein n=1 Tax=Hymenobacter arizonensis TaxID=1227077 RepID=A0A1I6BMF1_HYMAR|nr:hypothetical protein SAMN04515668_4739 [Hymenobacter arizonensis]
MFVASYVAALLASLSLSLSIMLLPYRLVLHIVALAGTLLLHACSQAPPDTATDSSLADAPAPDPTQRTTGTVADSLKGMQSHTFGEPLRNFPGLVLFSADDELGVRMYRMPRAGKAAGLASTPRNLEPTTSFRTAGLPCSEPSPWTSGPTPRPCASKLSPSSGPAKAGKT